MGTSCLDVLTVFDNFFPAAEVMINDCVKLVSSHRGNRTGLLFLYLKTKMPCLVKKSRMKFIAVHSQFTLSGN
jgi:hypothetical protein